MEDVQQAQQENHPRHLIATDRLMLVGNAGMRLDEVLTSVNKVLEEKQAPIKLVDDSVSEAQQKSESAESVDDAGPNIQSKTAVAEYVIHEDIPPIQVLTFAIQHASGPDTKVSEADILQSVIALDDAIAGGDLADQLVAVSPNWLMASSPPEGSAFGGPGARPVPLTGSIPPHDVRFYPRNDEVEDYLSNVDKNAEKNNSVHKTPVHQTSDVTIVILDTCPDPEIFAAQAGRNDLLSKLHQNLKIHSDPMIDAELDALSLTDDHVHAGHDDYYMVSHGIFAAGLIYSIIPGAKIHLVRVLNPYGIGTVNTVRRGLEIAMRQQKNGMPLVINLSLTMVFPYPEARGNSRLPGWLENWDSLWNDIDDEHKHRQKFLRSAQKSPIKAESLARSLTLPQRLRYAMELAARTAYQRGALLVAAAGNERKADGPPPMAQYPAAFDDVIGVGALESIPLDVDPDRLTEVTLASYSCSVDKPASAGFAVLGGQTAGGNPPVSDPDKGVVGVWVDGMGQGAAPGHGPAATTAKVQSHSGWVRWAGTSFAAPILSGALAILFARTGNRDQAVKYLQDGWQEAHADTGASSLCNDTPQVVLARQE